jgi:hypothetical protein
VVRKFYARSKSLILDLPWSGRISEGVLSTLA